MLRINRNLLILGAAQVLIFIIFQWGARDAEKVESRPFFNVDLSRVNSIESVSSRSSIKIDKIDNTWVIPQYDNLLASNKIVTELLADLAKVTVRWPVANTKIAAERFHVTEKTAHNIVRFREGKEVLATMYKGTTADWRTVHVRMADSEDVYSIPIETHRFNSDVFEWFEPSLLSINEPITSVKTADFTLSRENDSWAISSPTGNRYPNDKAISNWVKGISTFNVNGLVTEDAIAKNIISKNPTTEVSIITNVKTTTFEIYKNNDEAYLRRNGESNIFSISNRTANIFINADSTTLTLALKPESKNIADDIVPSVFSE